MTVMDEDPKTKVKTPTVMNGSSDVLVHDDAKRLATYTATERRWRALDERSGRHVRHTHRSFPARER